MILFAYIQMTLNVLSSESRLHTPLGMYIGLTVPEGWGVIVATRGVVAETMFELLNFSARSEYYVYF